jgi:hypothetical protein
MTDRSLQAFERQLVVALNEYASDVGSMPDPYVRARGIARANPRSRWRMRPLPLGARPAWILAALLLAALVGGLLVVGSRLLRTPQPVVPAVVPAELFGRWSNQPDGDPYIDFNRSTLLRSANENVPEIGRVVSFAWDPSTPQEAVIRFDAAAGCPPGQYRLVGHRSGSGGEGGPTPAPGPPDTGPFMIDSIRFTAPDDACNRRASILASGTWRSVAATLTGGATFPSLDFTEPFELALPAGLTTVIGSVGALDQLEAYTRLRIHHPFWSGFFLDDEPVYRLLCDSGAGTLPELPSSVSAIREWLAEAAPAELDGPMEVVVDGRTALRWKKNQACETFAGFAPGIGGDVVYAIPSGDDAILWTFRFDTADEEAIGDAIARSLHFK